MYVIITLSLSLSLSMYIYIYIHILGIADCEGNWQNSIKNFSSALVGKIVPNPYPPPLTKPPSGPPRAHLGNLASQNSICFRTVLLKPGRNCSARRVWWKFCGDFAEISRSFRGPPRARLGTLASLDFVFSSAQLLRGFVVSANPRSHAWPFYGGKTH